MAAGPIKPRHVPLRPCDEEAERHGGARESRLIQPPDQPDFRGENDKVNCACQYQATRQSVALEPSAHDGVALTSDADVMPGAMHVERLGEKQSGGCGHEQQGGHGAVIRWQATVD